MPPAYSRRDVLRICGAPLILGTAGCVSGSPTDNNRDEPNASDKINQSDSTTSERTTIAPSDVSNEAAKERALTAEEDYVTKQLQNTSCIKDWGLNSYTGFEREATITDRNTDGVEVAVSQPYWYSTDQEDADTGSKAHYLLTSSDTHRISGDNISPC